MGVVTSYCFRVLYHTIHELISSYSLTTMRLASPSICWMSLQAGSPGELGVQFQSKSKSLRTRRADGVVCVQRLAGSRPRKSRCFSSSLKAGKKLVSYSESIQAGEVSLLLRGGLAFLFYSELQLIGWAHKHERGQSALLGLYPHGNTENNA